MMRYFKLQLCQKCIGIAKKHKAICWGFVFWYTSHHALGDVNRKYNVANKYRYCHGNDHLIIIVDTKEKKLSEDMRIILFYDFLGVYGCLFLKGQFTLKSKTLRQSYHRAEGSKRLLLANVTAQLWRMPLVFSCSVMFTSLSLMSRCTLPSSSLMGVDWQNKKIAPT